MPSTAAPSKRRILIVEGDTSTREQVTDALQRAGYLTLSAQSAKDVVHKIKAWSPHLLLIDNDMSEVNGLEVLGELRTKKLQDYVSVIFLSQKGNVGDIVKGIDAGADDYLVKPVQTLELLARVRAKLRVKELNDALSRMNDRLAELVDTDELTGIFNMRNMMDRVSKELARAKRFRKPTSCALMDLDHFAAINEKTNYAFGNFVLSEMGLLLTQNTRTIDISARYGGDEFLIVFPETDRVGAERACERIRKAVEIKPFMKGEFNVKLTASFGIASCTHESALTAQDLVRAADHELHIAKQNGRNQISGKNV